jgi:hypothetical protein
MTKMKTKLPTSKDFQQKLITTWTSCVVFMVQGSLNLVTLNHVLIALKVSVASALTYLVLVPLLKVYKPFMQSVLLVGIVTIVDWQTHPSHFGGEMSEAIATAITAGILSYIAALLSLSKE